MAGPLAGMKLIEFDSMGPVPLAAKLLADMGADVLRIARAGVSDRAGGADLLRNRAVVRIDLKSPEGRDTALRLLAGADGMMEGFRPGVMERLGLGPDECLAVNPRLVYVRMTGWGQDGPLAARAGHDLNYIAITGVLNAIGGADRPPPPPLNLIGDYGGGTTFAMIGLLAGMLSARETGRGTVVDAAMVDGVAALSSAIHGMMNAGEWKDRRAENALDGAAPYYRCYVCADGKYVSVAAIEPQFFELLVDGLGIERARFAQRGRDKWGEMEAAFAACFASRPRDEWAEIFAPTDACVAPVLSFAEARRFPHNLARGIFPDNLPAAAPRFGGVPGAAKPAGDITVAAALSRWRGPPHRDMADPVTAPIAACDE
ncbi:MAG: CaiB/BaiF CoA-transferase family protein [Pseudomonadota bacterium]